MKVWEENKDILNHPISAQYTRQFSLYRVDLLAVPKILEEKTHAKFSRYSSADRSLPDSNSSHFIVVNGGKHRRASCGGSVDKTFSSEVSELKGRLVLSLGIFMCDNEEHLLSTKKSPVVTY